MKTKRNAEGYLLIQHDRQSPGVSDEAMRRTNPDLPAGSGRGTYEASTSNCSHCQKILVIRWHSQERPTYCRGCDAYICRECALVAKLHGECRPFVQVIEEAYDLASRGLIVPEFNRSLHG